ncbi:multidrug transporter [Flavobacteriaceae bacterium YJPT1-3]|nr:multidrug transporter [Flavobacteriaceae bacterium YJPT1-3]
MKNKYVLTGLAVVALLLGSCAADDTADIVINNTDNSVTNIDNSTDGDGDNGGDTTGQDINLEGTFANDLTLEMGNNYTITGPVVMAPGTRLTIPAGMTIEADASGGADVYIAISQGAEIIAQGTASQPIVITSNATAPAAGDWGGLIILGRAPINSTSGGATATSEIGGLPYGGADASDYSGVIQYVRLEYTGGKADGQSENNGFSFYGVGNATVVDHIQAYIGADDGVEFFGGTVNARFVSVIGSQDDSIDWTEGYTGTLTDVYVEHLGSAEFDKGIEADGFNTDIGNNSDPLYFSFPTINNLTIIGTGSTNGNEAIRLRAGTRVEMNNVLLQGFDEGIDMDGDMGNSPTGQGVVDGETQVNDITFTDVIVRLKNDTGFTFGEAELFTGIGNGTGTDYATWGAGWTASN